MASIKISSRPCPHQRRKSEAGGVDAAGYALDLGPRTIRVVAAASRRPACFRRPGNGVRVRTAQGFTFGDEQPDFASFYREYKLGSRDEWLAKLAQIRAANNILESDECVWVAGEPPESGVTCEEHFGFPV